VTDDDYLALVGIAVLAVLGRWFSRWAQKIERHEGRFRSLLVRATTIALYGGSLWITFQLAERVGTDVYVEHGTLLGHQSQSWSIASRTGSRGGGSLAAFIRVSRGTFFTQPVHGPVIVQYRVGRFSGRIYPLSVMPADGTK